MNSIQWYTSRDIIKPMTGNFKYYGSNNGSAWTDIRKKKLAQYNYICRYCGGFYKKYLIGYYLSGDPNNKYKYDDIEICCRPCYLVTHLNLGLIKELQLFKSDIPQMEIIRKTIQYVINNDKLPLPSEIDDQVHVVELSMYEFVNIIIKNNNNLPDELSSLKLFFSPKFDITFIRANFNTQQCMFIDNESDKDPVYESKNELDNILMKDVDAVNTNSDEHENIHHESIHHESIHHESNKLPIYKFTNVEMKTIQKFLHS